MRQIGYLFVIISFFFNSYFYCQLDNEKLKSEVSITYRDMLEIKLEILAVQISSGSYSQPDVVNYSFPVDIYINNDNKIVFEIQKKMHSDLETDQFKENIHEAMMFVMTGINNLILTNYKELKYNPKNSLLGYWYNPHDPEIVAKWEDNKLRICN